jgi:ABC-type amino acid transport substrate-binding protein
VTLRRLVEFAQPEQTFDAFASGQFEAVAWNLVNVFAIDRPGMRTIAIDLFDPWALWTHDEAFRDELDAVLLDLIADGTWSQLYRDAFGVAPLMSSDELLGTAPLER